MEAAGLGIFMVSASLFTLVLEHPRSPVRLAIGEPLKRRLLMGLAMGVTLVALIESPWGQQSGAHLNPSFTMTLFRLGKIRAGDALFYVLAQFAGGVAGLALVAAAVGAPLAEVQYIATLPGPRGLIFAFGAEAAISFLQMFTVLFISNTRKLSRFTGFIAAALVAAYITLEAPFSGMSMNPARSFAPALLGGIWRMLWIYFTAPPLGMFAAAQLYLALKGSRAVHCAKLNHHTTRRCIFRCRFAELKPPGAAGIQEAGEWETPRPAGRKGVAR
jgi:aquaporin Z